VGTMRREVERWERLRRTSYDLEVRGRGGPCLAGLWPAGSSWATLKTVLWGIPFI
jgi:hypothetical protein